MKHYAVGLAVILAYFLGIIVTGAKWNLRRGILVGVVLALLWTLGEWGKAVK